MARPRTDIEPRILAAARKSFRERGVEATSLRAIARDAGTSIGMIYYYYPTKDELFFAVVEETYQKLLADLERLLAPETSVDERLGRLFERVAQVSDEEVVILRLVAQEGLLQSPRFERLVERFLRGHVPLVLKTVFDGVRGGTLDAKRHPIVLLLAIFSLAGPPQFIRRALGARVPVPGAPEGTVLAHELVDVLLHGIAPAGNAAKT
jgi:AcrR family transcriptional regulator